MESVIYAFLLTAILSVTITYANGYKVKRYVTCLNGGEWRPKLNTCACNYSWAGPECSQWRYQFCYFDHGKNYRGQLSYTISGAQCLLWTTNHNNNLYELGKNGIGVHNYCRNPDNDPNGIWCYVGGVNLTEYCNATMCPESLRTSRNTTLQEDNNENESTVKFLFGPLISGICGGVVALLFIIGVVECVRRKGYCESKRKKKAAPKKKKGKKEKLKYPKFDSVDEWTNDACDVQPLGGVVTVNLDTGEHHRHVGNEKVIPSIVTTHSDAQNKEPKREITDKSPVTQQPQHNDNDTLNFNKKFPKVQQSNNRNILLQSSLPKKADTKSVKNLKKSSHITKDSNFIEYV